MKIQLDNPRTRAGWTCPICLGPKNQHLLACWECFRTSGLKDHNLVAEQKVAEFEDFLASQERREQR